MTQRARINMVREVINISSFSTSEEGCGLKTTTEGNARYTMI